MGKAVGRKALHKLTAREVAHATQPGYVGDGGNLWLQVSATGTKSWVFRYKRAGTNKTPEMGLGSLHTVSLAEAREKARLCRQQLLDGIDPLEARVAHRVAAIVARAAEATFDDCAEKYIAAQEGSWKNAKHRQQWVNTIETYASPVLGKLPVRLITDALILKVLEPIWTEKTETAERLRGRIENILDWAATKGYRDKGAPNPAMWRGNLEHQLPSISRRKRIVHHAALPYAEVGSFIAKLKDYEGLSASALEFTILTAARTNEVIGAKWDEFDLEGRTWVVPQGRMKAGVAHKVALSRRAVQIIESMRGRDAVYVFPGRKPETPMSNMAMLKLLERMGADDVTVHGFRASFKTWATETTNYPREVVEAALAHTVSDAVEAAYLRGTMFEKRRKLMDAWAKHCATPAGQPSANVTPIGRKAKAS